MPGEEGPSEVFFQNDTHELIEYVAMTTEVVAQKNREYQNTLEVLSALAVSLSGLEVLVVGTAQRLYDKRPVGFYDASVVVNQAPVLIESAEVMRPSLRTDSPYISIRGAILPTWEPIKAEVREGGVQLLPLPTTQTTTDTGH